MIQELPCLVVGPHPPPPLEHGTLVMLGLSPYLLGGGTPGNPLHNIWTPKISMLHEGARIRFILTSLSRAIEVVFSIRQGDPLAMILYIIYIEPLLLVLERDMVGLKVHNMEQKLEAYCDDINLTTNDLSDLGKISEVVEKFEVVSAAILSETYWPLAWLKPVKSLKIFGIFLADSYSEIQKLNWDFRFKKFSDVIFSWSPKDS